MSKKVLIISYYFPPLGFSGSLRGYYLALFLEKQGYDVTVITTEYVKYLAYDDSLKLPYNIKVIRLKTYDPQRYFSGSGKRQSGILRKINAHIFPLDNKIVWLPILKRAIEGVISKCRPNMIITTSPPPSIHLSCLGITRKYGIKWIADLRDAITDNQLKDNNKIVSFIEHKVEKSIVFNAFKVTVATEHMLRKLSDRYPAFKDKFVLMRNGFWGEDFKTKGKYKRIKGKINIAYISRLSHLTDIESFLKALGKLYNHKFGSFILRFAGVDATGELEDLIKWYDVQKKVVQYGYLKHRDAIGLMKSSDILLITLADIKGIEDVTTAKLYEYFGAKRPILLIAPEGTEAEMLIKKENAGECVRNGDTSSIAYAIIKLSKRKHGCLDSQNYTWEHSFTKLLDFI